MNETMHRSCWTEANCIKYRFLRTETSKVESLTGQPCTKQQLGQPTVKVSCAATLQNNRPVMITIPFYDIRHK